MKCLTCRSSEEPQVNFEPTFPDTFATKYGTFLQEIIKSFNLGP